MSSKKPNTDEIKNQLEGVVSAFANAGRSVNRESSQPINQPVNQLSDQSSSQSVDQPRDQSGDRVTRVGLYITRELDRKLDEAVRYFQERHGIKKVDRSIIVNAILGNESNWTEQSLDLIVDRVISQLTRRLIGQSIR